VQRPGTLLGPGGEVGVAAAEVCLGPCALLRQMGAGTHAQRPGLGSHVVVRRQLHRKVSLAAGAESDWE
jgi:hypothetical protein